MKIWKKLFVYIIIIFSLLGTFKVFKNVKILKSESYKSNIDNEYSKKLKACFDLENKNQRSNKEFLDLIKYCMEHLRID